MLSPVFLDLWLGTQFFVPPGRRNHHRRRGRSDGLDRADLFLARHPLAAKLAAAAFDRRGLTAAALLTAPWGTLSLVSLAYLASLPFAWRSYRRRAAAAKTTREGLLLTRRP
ncbi:hypothetical protein [Hankyongella ginsenosidimutans]|uniref:hypothetical protein n=1 Tax=Hankyongella ginsenosidimutans TaxID=1763828 RepID=UPI00319E37E6